MILMVNVKEFIRYFSRRAYLRKSETRCGGAGSPVTNWENALLRESKKSDFMNGKIQIRKGESYAKSKSCFLRISFSLSAGGFFWMISLRENSTMPIRWYTTQGRNRCSRCLASWYCKGSFITTAIATIFLLGTRELVMATVIVTKAATFGPTNQYVKPSSEGRKVPKIRT